MSKWALFGGRAFGACVVVGAAGVAGGCLIHADSSTVVEGSYIGPETIAQIEPGAKEEFVVATMGTPTTTTTLSDNSVIWKWTWRRRTQSDGKVFLLLSTESESEREGAAYVQMKDGVVTRAWRD